MNATFTTQFWLAVYACKAQVLLPASIKSRPVAPWVTTLMLATVPAVAMVTVTGYDAAGVPTAELRITITVPVPLLEANPVAPP